MTNEMANAIEKAMKKALAEVEAEFGGEFKFSGGSYGDTEYTPKVTFVLGTIEEQEKLDWDKYALRYDLAPGDFGKVITVDGKEYKIAGVRPSRRSYPVLATDILTGRQLLFRASVVKGALKS